ncbi:MAG: hypothetical protein ACE5EB_09660 [Thermodesulfobacteriota bacterium]
MKKRLSVFIAAVTFAVLSALLIPHGQAGEMVLAKSKNPCAAVNPCSMRKNPCSANPCSMKAGASSDVILIRSKAIKSTKDLRRLGKKLWKDTRLGKSGLACDTCHPKGMGLKKTPYPKYIKMPNDIVTLDQMINFCMQNPMKAKPLAWSSQEMTAIAAYVVSNSKGGSPAMNPCAGKNPCAMKNPCAGK